MSRKFIVRVYRGVPGKQYWEEFECLLKPFYNVTTLLMDIQKNPVNKQGQRVEPVVWEQGCLEIVCGSCSMLINGRPAQGCGTLIERVLKESGSDVLTLAPFTKFPLLRDLVVDRTKMFDALKKVHAWIPASDSSDQGFGPPISFEVQEQRYRLSTCMSCGCCSEACPQVNAHSSFIGPAAISQVRLFNTHPIGKLSAKERLQALMGDGGVSDCGNAQNCVAVCPKGIPLTESIAYAGRHTVKQALHDLFSVGGCE